MHNFCKNYLLSFQSVSAILLIFCVTLYFTHSISISTNTVQSASKAIPNSVKIPRLSPTPILRDLYQDPLVEAVSTNAESVLLLTTNEAIKKSLLWADSLITEPINLCDNDPAKEPFNKQPTIPNNIWKCTAVAVAPDLALTARHCLDDFFDSDGKKIDENQLKKLRLVSGFSLALPPKNPPMQPLKIKAIFEVRNVVLASNAADPNNPQPDFALLFLKGPKLSKYLTVADFSTENPTTVYSIGHPLGLPLKITRESKITEKHSVSFVACLNSFRGSSGSPVFDDKQNKIVGVLFGGVPDLALSSEPTGQPCKSLQKALRVEACEPMSAITPSNFFKDDIEWHLDCLKNKEQKRCKKYIKCIKTTERDVTERCWMKP